ncbi:unnamed protein product [Brassica oleracea var. botrytis]
MWLAPIRSNRADRKKNEFDGALTDWDNFSDEFKSFCGVDMNVSTKPLTEEQEKYYIQGRQEDPAQQEIELTSASK